MYSTTTTAAAADHGGATSIAAIHPDIIQSHILKRLDGATLAATTCASKQLLSVCTDDHLWREISNSTWPSTAHPTVLAAIADFPSGHRSLYSDSFPASRTHHSPPARKTGFPDTSELISAVDIFFDGELIYSKVLTTETLSGWFHCSPLRIDLLHQDEAVATPLKFDGEEGACIERAAERLRVSWILIDPSKNRAVNVGGSKAVEARWHWLTGDVKLRYGAVVDCGGDEVFQCGVVVTCGGKEGGELMVREISMQIEDVEGKTVTGLDSLRILDRAMEGQRCKFNWERERENYEMFKRTKVGLREMKERRERRLDTACVVAGVSIVIGMLVLLLARRGNIYNWSFFNFVN
ncbi:hypothetical protein CASFOL_035115 [Castilleja foliolosa]|uniref:F-box domain-containing protein n=1 Tax=Castilleja foliolosa TaxID=1961234 RepID=A0ABD3BRP8_9LAMI